MRQTYLLVVSLQFEGADCPGQSQRLYRASLVQDVNSSPTGAQDEKSRLKKSCYNSAT